MQKLKNPDHGIYDYTKQLTKAKKKRMNQLGVKCCKGTEYL